MTRVFVGGVGYRHLCDHSFGMAMTDELAARTWGPEVSIEDASYNPIALVQRLQDDPADRRFSLAILVGAMPRLGRPPGTVDVYRWDQRLPPPEDIHQAITEAVTGVISLDNTLVIARYFEVLPKTVVVIDVEPLLHTGGDSFSPVIAEAFARVRDDIIRLAGDPAAAAALPIDALGGDRVIADRFGLARVSDVHARRN